MEAHAEDGAAMTNQVFLDVTERNAILFALQMCIGLLPVHGPDEPSVDTVLDLLMKLGRPVTAKGA